MKESPVPDMYNKIESESTGLGKMLSSIPGFDGYIERGRRREADQILRETIASRLESSRQQLASVHQELSRDIVRAMDFAESIGRADTRLMGLIGKVNSAPQGYAGFFDAVKVKEDDLQRVYNFDEAMLNYAEDVSVEISAIEKTINEEGDIADAIHELDLTLREANAAFDSRTEILSGVAP